MRRYDPTDRLPDDDVSRRQFVASAARSLLGVSMVPLAGSVASAQTTPGGSGGAGAKQVIYLFMSGAMSHLETLDPKPGVEEGGPTKAINTAVPGIRLSEHLPRLAKQMNQVAVIRSLTTQTGAHQPGRYVMRTGYKEIASTRHPSLGAFVQRLAGKISRDLPGNVVIGDATRHPGAGFLDAQYAAVPVGDPAKGLQNTEPPAYLAESQFNRRMLLASQFDQGFRRKYTHADVKAYTDLYREAVALLKSKDLAAFDIDAEPRKTRDAYGDNRLGQGCLLARRLIENGVRFAEVVFGGWDDHREIFDNLPERVAILDQALSTLLTDLKEKGLLDSTLVVLCSEFGRSPKINPNSGRDHHPGVFSAALAGAGIRGGQVYGRTDETAFGVAENAVTVPDFNATIAAAMGLPLDRKITSPDGRPFTIAHDGKPIKAVLSHA